MKTFAFIFARGGSKGVPGKNFKILAGKPLIAHSIELATIIQEIDMTFVSTDDIRIAGIAKDLGVEVIDRPQELAQDTSPEWLAWQHAIDWVLKRYGEFDRFISLPSTSPLRSSQDVRTCLGTLTEDVDMVVTMVETNRSPWFNMVKRDLSGNLQLLLASDYSRRQDVPTSYDMATVAYVSRPGFILKSSGIWTGSVRGVVVPEERAIDIDTPLDFKIADMLMIGRDADERSK